MTYQEAIEKVAKLLRKGNNAATSAEEAAVFLAKAQQMITDYKLAVDDLDFDKNQAEDNKEEVKDFGYADPLDNVKYGNYRESWTLRLAGVVAWANQCATRYRRTETKGSIIRIVGRPSDVAACRYLYSFFRTQIEELQRVHCKGNSSAFKGEFAIGCIDTLSRRLREQEEQAVKEVKIKHADNPMALVRVNTAVARIDQRREDVNDFFNSFLYQGLADEIGVTFEQAKLFSKHRFEQAKALFESEEAFNLAKQAYDDYQEKISRVKVRYGRGGFSGAGARTSTGGREAGQKAGESIRMTGSKGSIGNKRGQIGS
jgi:hypothetical protein